MFPQCCKDCSSNQLFCWFFFFKFPIAVLHWILFFIKLNISFLLPSQFVPSSHQVTSNMQLACNLPPSLVCPGVSWCKPLSNLLKLCPQSSSKIGIICAIHVLHIFIAYYIYQFLVHSLWTTASLYSPIMRSLYAFFCPVFLSLLQQGLDLWLKFMVVIVVKIKKHKGQLQDLM